MGEFFRSYDEAWDFFLSHEEPLEWFFGDFPEDERFVAEGWLIEPSPAIKAGAASFQAQLERCEWLVPIPGHFLHVWLGGPIAIGEHAYSWEGTGPFDIDFRGVNCFHSAVVVEARAAPQLARLIAATGIDTGTFLPHLTIAVTRAQHDAAELVEILAPLRETALGSSTAVEVKRVRFPAARKTLLEPWEVVEVVRL